MFMYRLNMNMYYIKDFILSPVKFFDSEYTQHGGVLMHHIKLLRKNVNFRIRCSFWVVERFLISGFARRSHVWAAWGVGPLGAAWGCIRLLRTWDRMGCLGLHGASTPNGVALSRMGSHSHEDHAA
jgi:hypothetical protein